MVLKKGSCKELFNGRRNSINVQCLMKLHFLVIFHDYLILCINALNTLFLDLILFVWLVRLVIF